MAALIWCRKLTACRHQVGHSHAGAKFMECLVPRQQGDRRHRR